MATAAQKLAAKKAAIKKKAGEAAKRAKKAAEDAKYVPQDYLKGSKAEGKSYTAADNFGQGTPDRGRGAGPGTPYHEVTKKIPKRASAIATYNVNQAKTKLATAKAEKDSGDTGNPLNRTKPIPAYRQTSGNAYSKTNADFRTEAIRRRLQGVK